MTGKRFLPEKRTAARAKHDPVIEIFDEAGKRVPCVATLSDISASGAGFRSTHQFAKGARISVRLRLLGQAPQALDATVVRHKDFENYTLYAVAFDGTCVLPRRNQP